MTAIPKISKPAGRALAAAGIVTLEQVAEHSENDLLALHGVGPTAIRLLREVMAEKGMRFREDK